MARTAASPDGRPRVQLSATIAPLNHDFVDITLLKIRKKDPSATKSEALNSIVEFARIRRFDPIAPLHKIMRPVKASTPPPAKSATPSGQKG